MTEGMLRLKSRVTDAITNAIDDGNVSLSNEISANMTVAAVMFVITAMNVCCWILNEIGVFTADLIAMRIAVAAAIIIEVPTQAIARRLNGARSWMKYLLLSALGAQCTIMVAVLGHNVFLVMIIPMLVSLRYYNSKLTHAVIWIGAAFFIGAAYFCAYNGIVNLNNLVIEPGTAITVTGSLREALLSTDYDQIAYVKSLTINDLVPRMIIYIAIAFICTHIAKRGKEMVELQNTVASRTARVNTELELATRIQIGMLPCTFPAFPEDENLEIFAFNTPAKEVGGDFYDYFRVDDHRIAIVMADVSGKGVGAALFMTISKIIIKNQLQMGKDPCEALTIANQQLCENNEAGLFVTVWAGVLDTNTGIMTYVNAGHNPPVLRRDNKESDYLTGRTGFVLAGFEGMKYKQSEFELRKGDELVLYTDGVTEATSATLELYGEDRLLAALDTYAGYPMKDILLGIKKDLEDFAGGAEQFDDITMLGLRVH